MGILIELSGLQSVYYDLRDRINACYRKPVDGIPASDLALGVIPDVIGTGINSLKNGVGVAALGNNSQAQGAGTVASGAQAHAEGSGTNASGVSSHAEGGGTEAKGAQAHAEGGGTQAIGESSHAEGGGTQAIGMCSHTEGASTIAAGVYQHASGKYNVADGPNDVTYPPWTENTHFAEGATIRYEYTWGGREYKEYYYCVYEHTSSDDFVYDLDTMGYWVLDERPSKFVEIVGNGDGDDDRANARALDWLGNEFLAGDLYVHANPDGTGGYKVARLVDLPDVQINGSSILQNGVANIPLAGTVNNANVLGVCKPGGMGVAFNNTGEIYIVKATSAYLKAGASNFHPIVPGNQHESAFYALAKLVGADMSSSSNAVGTYTDAAKQGIQKLFGLAGIFGPYEDDTTADRAYVIGETFIMNGKRYKVTAAIAQGGAITPGTNCEPDPMDGDYVKKTDYTNVDNLLDHETYEGSGQPIIEYNPVTPSQTVTGAQLLINGYETAHISTPSGADVKIFPVENGKTYKVIGRCATTKPILVVADSLVTSGTIGLTGDYDYQYGTYSDNTVEEQEYTALRTGYLYITSSTSACGLWLKNVIVPTVTKYHIDDVVSDVSGIKTSITELGIIRTKEDSTVAMVKNIPRNADRIAKVTNIANTVTLVRSITGRNLINKNAVGDVPVNASGTLKVGMRTVHVPAGRYYCILGNVGNYTMVKKVENGIYTTLYKDQFPMILSITDPAGGYFIVYASSLANLGDTSGIMIGRLRDDEKTLSFEAYSEKTYTPATLAEDNRIEVRPYSFVEFVNASNADVSSTIEYTVYGKDDDTTTRKEFIVSPDGSKFLPMAKDDGSIACARVIPKKALFIGNSLTSGWQTFGEAATEHDLDFVGRFSAVIADMESNYSFNRKWSTGFEQQTSLANAQSWVATNIDPLLSSDLDLIIVQLCENVVVNASAVATFPESSLWLMQHLRTECPKARVVWMGLWFERGWVDTLLKNTAKAGCEYIDIRPLYKPENVSVIGTVYKMDSDYTKSYDVDSFTVDNGQITLVFTVDGVEYTSTIPSYTSYTSSGDTQISVTGIYHVVSTYYASIHPGDEGFRKIANKMLFDLGISDSEETIHAN